MTVIQAIRQGLSTSMLTTVLVLSASTMGCRPNVAPVYVPQSAVTSPTGGPIVLEELRQAIVRGLMAKRWNVIEDAPGELKATVAAGGHTASVSIRYNEGGYVIEHLSSSPGLRFDGQLIHRRYNHWVRLLDDAVKEQILAPTPTTVPRTTTAAPAATQPAPAQPATTPVPAQPAVEGPAPDPSWDEDNPPPPTD